MAPELRNFILPTGPYHVARAAVRRAERRAVEVNEKETIVVPEVLSYLNRVSDLLFALARTDPSNPEIAYSVSRHRRL